MRKRIKNKNKLSLKSDNVTKTPIRILYKKVGQAPEVKIIDDVHRLKETIAKKNLDIIPYEKIFIICHNKKSSSNVNVNREMYKILNLVMYNFVHY